MGALTDVISRAARSVGVEIQTGAPVAHVIVEDSTASGVLLNDGEEIRSRIVISNADPKHTFTALFRPNDLGAETLKRVNGWKTNCGCLKFMAAMRELPDLSGFVGKDFDRETLVGMKILPSLDYYQRSWDDMGPKGDRPGFR